MRIMGRKVVPGREEVERKWSEYFEGLLNK